MEETSGEATKDGQTCNRCGMYRISFTEYLIQKNKSYVKSMDTGGRLIRPKHRQVVSEAHGLHSTMVIRRGQAKQDNQQKHNLECKRVYILQKYRYK